jgi:hypothetical protein
MAIKWYVPFPRGQIAAYIDFASNVRAYSRSADLVRIENAHDDINGLIPVYDAQGNLRVIELDTQIDLDFSTQGPDGRDTGSARTENTGYDIRIVVSDSFSAYASIASVHGSFDPADLPAGWGSVWRSPPLKYVCLNRDNGTGTFDDITPFDSFGRRHYYRGCATEAQILNSGASSRTAIPFVTVATARSAQFPTTGRVAYLHIEAINDNNTPGNWGLYMTDTCSDPLWTLDNLQSGVQGESIKKELAEVVIPIGDRTVDTAVYFEWTGGPGAPVTNAYVMGFEL